MSKTFDERKAIMKERGDNVLEGERFKLRPLKNEDLEIMEQIYCDNYCNAMVAPVTEKSPDGAKAKLEKLQKYQEEDGLSCWAIEDKKSGEKYGIAGITYVDDKKKDVELNIALTPSRLKSYNGRAVAEDLRDEMADLIFEKLEFDKVYTEGLSYNKASYELARNYLGVADNGIVPMEQGGTAAANNKKDTYLVSGVLTKASYEEFIKTKKVPETHKGLRSVSSAVKEMRDRSEKANGKSGYESTIEDLESLQKNPVYSRYLESELGRAA